MLTEACPATCAAVKSQKSKKWVVVHNAARDQYQLPIALMEGGVLERFFTDWYTPKDHRLWRYLTHSNTLGSSFGLQSRFRKELPSTLVADRKGYFIWDLCYRRLFRKPFNDLKAGAKTSRRAAEFASRHSVNLFATSYCSGSAFSNLSASSIGVLFQVHPQPRYLRDLYKRMLAGPNLEFSGLRHEAEMRASEAELTEWEKETQLAQYVICASSFSRISLLASGVPADRITVISYGVDINTFRPATERPGQRPFTVLYVGQKIARKNLGGLLKAWKALQPQNARLIVAGGHIRDEELVRAFQGSYEEISRIDLPQLVRLFQFADLFVLPSIAEGFGHVYLESLACGTPIICTDNTGGPDIIKHGESGWILPAGDQDALRNQLSWCLQHRELVRSMREAARSVAENHTWAHFRGRVRAHLEQLSASFN